MEFNLEQRVDSLEYIFGQFISQTGAIIKRLERGMERQERTIERLERSDEAFKEEMRAFKDEMKDFKDEMKDFKDEMKDFKDEMKDFKDEMLAYKEESRRDRKLMNKRWGELANKMGKMVEDLVYPSIERIIRETFDLEVERLNIRVKVKRENGARAEYDAIAIAKDKIFINSTKSSLKSSDVDELVEMLKSFRDFLPEHRDKKAIGILATLNVDDSVLAYAEKKGFLVLAVGEEIMEVKNSEKFRVKEY